MPSPITTGGFQVQATPGIQYLDPRLLTPDFTALPNGINAGLNTYGKLHQIAQDAQSDPLRQQLLQIQANTAAANASLVPQEVARQRVILAQPIKDSEGVGIESVDRPLGQITQATEPDGTPAVDANNNPIMEREAIGSDVFLNQTTKEIDPFTGAETIKVERTKPLSTVEQQANEASLADYHAQLANYRNEMAQANLARANAPKNSTLLLAQARQAAASEGDDATVKIIDAQLAKQSAIKTGPETTVSLLQARAQAQAAGNAGDVSALNARIEKRSASGVLPAGASYQRAIEKQAADAGVPQSMIASLVKTPEGTSALAKMAYAHRKYTSAESPDTFSLAPEELAALQKASAAPAPAPEPAAPVSFNVPGLSGSAPASAGDSQFRIAAPSAQIPSGAIQTLISNPGLAAAFEAKYGAGSSAQYLRQ